MKRFLCVFMYFCCLLLLRMTEHLQMFWPHFASICVPFLFSPASLLTEHIFAELLKSDPSFFVLPFSVSVPVSYHPFPVMWIKRLWRLHNGAICWSRPKRGFKAFHSSFGTKPLHLRSYNGCYAWCVWDAFATPLVPPDATGAAPGPSLMPYFTNSEPPPATLGHLCWNREIDLYSIIISNLTDK